MRLNVDGTAGCGKTYLVRAICQELRRRRIATDHGQPDPIRFVAPSGVAAWNIGGRTIHSALSLSATGGALTPLTGRRLATLQRQWKGVHFLIIDEKSMLGQRTLAKVDGRLRQLKPQDSLIGGFHAALFGDFAQLPPVGDRAHSTSRRAQWQIHQRVLRRVVMAECSTTALQRVIISRSYTDRVAIPTSRCASELFCNMLARAASLSMTGTCCSRGTPVVWHLQSANPSTPRSAYSPNPRRSRRRTSVNSLRSTRRARESKQKRWRSGCCKSNHRGCGWIGSTSSAGVRREGHDHAQCLADSRYARCFNEHVFG